MALTKKDVESAVELGVLKAMQTVIAEQERHKQTLYGATGDNGLNGDVRNLKNGQKYLYRFAWMLTGGLILAGSLLGASKFNIL